MYLAIMSCMCLLSLAVGVYSYGNEITETEIIVTVSTPRNFLLNDSAIFFSMNKTSDLKIFELPLKVTWFGEFSHYRCLYWFFIAIYIYSFLLSFQFLFCFTYLCLQYLFLYFSHPLCDNHIKTPPINDFSQSY